MTDRGCGVTRRGLSGKGGGGDQNGVLSQKKSDA